MATPPDPTEPSAQASSPKPAAAKRTATRRTAAKRTAAKPAAAKRATARPRPAAPSPEAEPHQQAQMTIDERTAFGKTAREKVSRKSHGEWAPAPDRADPISFMEEQAATRVPELVPLRHGRMAASAFAFYRGAALVMAADLAAVPHSDLTVQLCGDAHLANFGAFRSPERKLVFSVNDFDETLPGPFEWDVKRLAASIEIAGQSRGFPATITGPIVEQTVRSYREAMASFAATSNLDTWYTTLDIEGIQDRWGTQIKAKETVSLRKSVTKAESKTRLRALTKLTHVVDGEVRFLSNPPLLVPFEELAGSDTAGLHDVVVNALESYRDTLSADRRHLLGTYRFVELARKVVGVGSVGTRCWVALYLGRDNDDPLILQIKEAEASVLERFLAPSKYPEQGQRVVEGQRLMQAASDIFLGWERIPGTLALDNRDHDYYVRQLWDGKGSAAIETMTPHMMGMYGEMCAWTLARAHARSGDPIAITAYLGKSAAFDKSIAAFSRTYAAQNTKDHQALVDAIASGRVQSMAEPV